MRVGNKKSGKRKELREGIFFLEKGQNERADGGRLKFFLGPKLGRNTGLQAGKRVEMGVSS